MRNATITALPALRQRSRLRRVFGISYTEVLVACGLFGIAAGSGILGLVRINNSAALSRLQTGASTVAQGRIDLILGDGPFNPQKEQIPPTLTPGTQTIGTSSNPTIPIYTDPATGVATVKGWMTSTVEDSGTTFNSQNLHLYRASVTVSYRYRGKIYTVRMSTVRTSDI